MCPDDVTIRSHWELGDHCPNFVKLHAGTWPPTMNMQFCTISTMSFVLENGKSDVINI